MKNIYIRFYLIIFCVFGLASCSVFEKPNPYSDNVKPFTDLVFKLDLNAADNYNLVSGSFKSSCNAIVFIKLTGETSSVRVARFNTTTNTSELKTTLTPVGGVATLDIPVASLTLAGVVPTAGTVVLEFTAVSSDGKTTTRRFTITVAPAGAC